MSAVTVTLINTSINLPQLRTTQTTCRSEYARSQTGSFNNGGVVRERARACKIVAAKKGLPGGYTAKNCIWLRG